MKDIINARNFATSDLASGLPDVAASIQEVLQGVKASYIQKQQINGYTQETLIEVITKVSIQPLTPQQLRMLPEGQRKWRYFTVFALKNLDLQPDEVFTIKGRNFRIQDKKDWKEFGFIAYNTIEDYNLNAPDPTLGQGYNV
jgi:hypothetical protein